MQPLTPEAFRPYGHMLKNKQPLFPEVASSEGRVAVELLKIKRPANARRISMMATHFSYNQTFIPVRGTMALVVAPPPHNPNDGHQNYELDYERLAAFFLEPGQAAFMKRALGITPSRSARNANSSISRARIRAKAPAVSTTRCGWTKFPSCARTSKCWIFRSRDKRTNELEV
jgi:hypothetical protein